MGQHPRLRWSRKRRSVMLENYKRAFIRHHKLIYQDPQKRSYPLYVPNIFEHGPIKSTLNKRSIKNDDQNEINHDNAKKRRNFIKRNSASIRSFYRSRMKRGLKSKGSSSTLGLSHKSSGSSLNLRRGGNKRYEMEDNNEITFIKKKKKNKFKGPCPPLSSEPYVNVEIVKHGRDQNVSYGSGTIVKMACGKGYGLNLPENKTAKCVRGKWKPMKPMCLICE